MQTFNAVAFLMVTWEAIQKTYTEFRDTRYALGSIKVRQVVLPQAKDPMKSHFPRNSTCLYFYWQIFPVKEIKKQLNANEERKTIFVIGNVNDEAI